MATPNGLMFDRRRPDEMRRPVPPGAPAVPQPESMAGTDGMDKAMADMTQGALPKVPTGGPPGKSGGNGLLQRRPKPVTLDREGNPVPGVSGRLQTLTDSDSPYIQRARTRAKQTANRRGLMNSSIAAGAGEAAAIDAALPIATADANIAAGERAMRSQEFQQARSIRSQELMQQKGLDHDEAMRQADRELSKLLQQRDHDVQKLMQTQRLSHDAAMQRANRALQARLAGMREASQISMQQFALAHSAEQAGLQRDFAAGQAELDRAQQLGLQGRTIEAAERAARDVGMRSINSMYGNQILTLSLNTNIPVEERRALEEHFGFMRDQSMEALGNVYDYTPTWESTRRP